MSTLTQRYDPAVPIGQLIEHPENPRKGQVDLIGESITANGFYGAVYVQESTGRVIAGNHRLRAARAVGEATLPVIYLDVDDERARRILLVDNRAGDKAGYDDTLLAELLAGFDGDLSGTGYDDTDLADVLNRMSPPTLDQLGDKHGTTPLPTDTWVTVAWRVPAITAQRLTHYVNALPGQSEADRIAALVDRLPTS
jgi:hypothetical protein